MEILKLKDITEQKNCLGFITKDKKTKKFYTQNFNDLGFWFDSLDDLQEEYITTIKKIFITKTKFIYQLKDENLQNFDLTDYKQAIENFKN